MNLQGDDVTLPTASVLSKMIANPKATTENVEKIDVGDLEGIVRQLAQKDAINEDLLSLFPDLRFCADTASLSIVSPNDMTSKKYNLNFEKIMLGSEIKNSIAETIKNNINAYYNFDSMMPDIVQEALFIKGAHVEVFIPEASLDGIINGDSELEDKAGEITVESFVKQKDDSKGIFGKSRITNKTYSDIISLIGKDNIDITSESANATKTTGYFNNEKELLVEFSDDYTTLFKGFVTVESANKKVDDLYKGHQTTEAAKKADNLKIQLSKIFKDSNKLSEEPLLNIEGYSDTVRKSVGRPLHLIIDKNVIKPIWAVKPENHIGYLVPIDETGNIIDAKSLAQDNMNNVTMYGSGENKTITDTVLGRALKGLKSMTNDVTDLDNMEALYGGILHNVIVDKIKSGTIGSLGTLSKDQNFLNLMFKRALAGKKTKVLYLPVSVVSYMAYEYRDNGVGLSRLDKISVIISMRAIMLFAKLMANIKNSIPITEVEATIDSKEPDVKAAIGKIISSTMKTHQVSMPIGTANVNDLVQWVHNLGYVYNITSDRLPDTKIKYSDSSRNIKVPEDTISEVLEELCYMEFFMNADMVKSGSDVNFATTIVSQNKLYENRITKQQLKTEFIFTKHIKTIIANDTTIRNEVASVLKANLKEIKKLNKDKLDGVIKLFKDDDELCEVLIEIMVDDIKLTLPRPTTLNEGNNLKTIFEDYTGAIDSYLNTIFADEAYAAVFVGDELNTNIDGIKAVMKKVLIQEWVDDNNYIPSMSKFLTLDDSGVSMNNIFGRYTSMMDVFGGLVTKFMADNKKTSEKLDNDLTKINEGQEENEEEETGGEVLGDSTTDEDKNEDDILGGGDTGEDILDDSKTEDTIEKDEKEEEVVDEEDEDSKKPTDDDEGFDDDGLIMPTIKK